MKRAKAPLCRRELRLLTLNRISPRTGAVLLGFRSCIQAHAVIRAFSTGDVETSGIGLGALAVEHEAEGEQAGRRSLQIREAVRTWTD